MPYKIDSENLPEHVQKMPMPMREAWVKTWNGVYEKCEAEDGENCEARAFAVANSAVENMGQPTGGLSELVGKVLSNEHYQAITEAWERLNKVIGRADKKHLAEADAPHYRLAAGDERCGNFMHLMEGVCQKYDFTPKANYVCDSYEAKEMEPGMMPGEMVGAPFLMVELTAASLTAGKPFDGVVMGEFVDMYGRDVKLDRKDKAAYIANTKRAIEATRGESGELAGLPIDAKNHDKGDAAGWIVDVIDGGGDLIRFLANWTEIGVELIGKGIRRFFSPTINSRDKVILGGSLANWIASTDKTGVVMMRPVELARGIHTFQVNQPAGDSPAVNISKGAKTMNLNDLSPEDKQTLLAQAQVEFVAKLAPAGSDGGETYEQRLERLRKDLNLSAFAELTDVDAVRAALQKNMEEVLTAELARVDEYANRRLAQMMAERRKSLHIAEFAATVTGGTNERPYGLPIGREEIETFLSGLNDQQRGAAESIIRRAWENDLVPFSELGHGKEPRGTRKLEAPIARQLAEFVKGGGRAEDFFLAAADILGDMKDYDLSEVTNG